MMIMMMFMSITCVTSTKKKSQIRQLQQIGWVNFFFFFKKIIIFVVVVVSGTVAKVCRVRIYIFAVIYKYSLIHILKKNQTHTHIHKHNIKYDLLKTGKKFIHLNNVKHFFPIFFFFQLTHTHTHMLNNCAFLSQLISFFCCSNMS